MKRTRLSVCRRKARFVSQADALIVAQTGRIPLSVYRCDRCLHFHLTSRTKGKRVATARTRDVKSDHLDRSGPDNAPSGDPATHV